MSFSRRRVRLELFDENGDKVTLIFEGRLTRDKIIQLADFIELYGGGEITQPQVVEGSKLVKVVKLIERYFPFSHFSSKEVQRLYEAEYREPISLSTVSTYLSRLANRGVLERTGGGSQVKYKLLRPLRSEISDFETEESL
ncbi:MAG: hypothetical protein RMJ14_01540 [Nitrososphaerota archaeon]|nr:hypothetical protein [Aigarchaeota archaeon]MDW8076307.1 hypothetical protein [Nitrososphaerota archaeon]